MFPRDQDKKKNGTIESIIIWVTISECERNKGVFHLFMISLVTILKSSIKKVHAKNKD